MYLTEAVRPRQDSATFDNLIIAHLGYIYIRHYYSSIEGWIFKQNIIIYIVYVRYVLSRT